MTESTSDITPYSQIINIFIFVPFVLITTIYLTLVFQAVFITLSAFMFKVRFGDLRIKHLLYLLPILLFVFVFNSFRGGGEIFFRAGPFMVIRQGITRGIYYSVFILELYFMSRALTAGFREDELISVMRRLSFRIRKEKIGDGGTRSRPQDSFFMILYYVIRMFHNTYSELQIFFKGRSHSLKEKTILFIKTIFFKSMSDFRRHMLVQISDIKPKSLDYLYVLLQIIFLSSAMIIETKLI